MPILRSYYQDVYRSPVVRLDGYSGRHGLTYVVVDHCSCGIIRHQNTGCTTEVLIHVNVRSNP